MKKLMSVFVLALFGLFGMESLSAQQHVGKLANKPLFRDPIYDGAADPVVIWNKKEKKWFLFYTNRRASDTLATGVTWVHGTRIGIAESKDGGATWKYRDTANIKYRPTPDYTHWAPEVIEHEGTYHMYLTYVPGVFKDWGHPRDIIHLTSKDLLNWDYVSTLKLASDKVIDACVIKRPDATWRMWYNNERDSKSIYYADSKDLNNWETKGKAVSDRGGEGPKVFYWKGKYWMLVDNWAGMGLYYSNDLLKWTKQPERLLEFPGKGLEDQAIGGHADVVIQGDRAFVYYFTHPGRSKAKPAPENSIDSRRSLIYVAELEYNKDGFITCDRDKPVYVNLKKK
ncbi:family 43 glycosylhydrolase [Arcticibacter eurypsychrophilus]|uniref:family 43 glycosylhydrolase n=1 Tax=Arcticibacter eurypsychrophilus TaxID=1434752 RepID=UPI001112D85E|nr:family 43 glycosylhydrolase [Arcticibacter eurypsychrophilus]